jgi:small subunit ribosomal protein S13
VDGSKKLAHGLSKIRGVGINFAQAVAKTCQINPDARVGTLRDEDIQKIEAVINNPEKTGLPVFLYNRRKDLESGLDKHLHDPDVSLRTKMDIDFMKSIKCWKGIRHSWGLKVRGQKTRTTGRTGRAVGVRKKALIAAAAAAAKSST